MSDNLNKTRKFKMSKTKTKFVNTSMSLELRSRDHEKMIMKVLKENSFMVSHVYTSIEGLTKTSELKLISIETVDGKFNK